MKPEEQRIAIAEACGWTWKQGSHADFLWHDPQDKSHSSFCKERSPLGCIADLPDYLNDLNAMHEAEKAQFYKDVTWHRRYARELHRIVIRDWNDQGDGKIDDDPKEAGWLAWYLGSHAIATQRAEAFLKTLNLWKEN